MIEHEEISSEETIVTEPRRSTRVRKKPVRFAVKNNLITQMCTYYIYTVLLLLFTSVINILYIHSYGYYSLSYCYFVYCYNYPSIISSFKYNYDDSYITKNYLLIFIFVSSP